MTKLNDEPPTHRERIESRNRDFVAAYDRLVERLTALDRGEVGPRIGERMPPFVLPDAGGRLLSLSRLVRGGPVVVSFNRGHWCPYCKVDLRSLAARYDRIRGLGANVVSIMPDSAQFTGEYADKNELPFPVLSDIDLGYSLSLGLIFWVGAEVQRLYREVGVTLDRYHGNDGYFLPMAAKFVIGEDGLVKMRRVNVEFRERVEPDEVISALEQLHREG
jgi:peroxiredoxin